MRRLLALTALAAAAVTMSAPADAACYGPGMLGACVSQGCYDSHCTVPQVTVSTYCAHPAPPACTFLMFAVQVP
jgi:TRAP-type C4-dicarboxylate transport system permease large subunit